MKKTIFVTFLILFSLQANIKLIAADDYKVDHKQEHVLELAKTLPQIGVLRKKSNGYVYLDVSNEYITKTFTNLILDGHLRPTDSFGAEEGAHITVIKENEDSSGIENEIGKEFIFQVNELRTVASFKTEGGGMGGKVVKYHTGDRWFIAVESPELEELRTRCGLTPLIDEHDFHITIGFEVPFSRINNFGERPH